MCKLIIMIAILFVLVGFATKTKKQDIKKACFKERCFEIEIADSNYKRRRGLMGREYLVANSGMLFIFNRPGKHGIWMKNTLIPLDIIWIDENNKVIFIKENFKPCGDKNCPVAKPKTNAKYVLEINAGEAKKINIKIGNEVFFK